MTSWLYVIMVWKLNQTKQTKLKKNQTKFVFDHIREALRAWAYIGDIVHFGQLIDDI